MNEMIVKDMKEDELEISESADSLNSMTEEELIDTLHGYEESADILLKENKVYRNILNRPIQSNVTSELIIPKEGTDEDSQELSYSKKCFLARKYLENLECEFDSTKSNYTQQLKELKFRLDSLKLTLKNTQDAKDNFNSDVLLEKHPVSKKFILQKVAKYFEDSIKNKRAMSNRYKIQIEGMDMDNNKLLNQLQDQNKRLVSIDTEKCQEMKYEHMKTCEALDKQKQSVVVCKTKYNKLGQKVFDLKKALQKEESELSNIQEILTKKKYMKSVMISEKQWNEQREEGLMKAIHKIRVDPRRHDLPEVLEYACIKRENEQLKRNIKMWKKKVAIAEQAKLMHLNILLKKNKIS